ncbi:sulfur carrier protein ThiS [Aestuariibacter sp. A3R04]|uniref:sulfur carrier protein ThiS n=1 Tax=Aestuariibacter sp. A3R04 TaxID=2841571 RepID=UPI001C09C41C|nr:sulfur carrier protein ThiS [Aestuariibacter sp. A3R04]MBU3023718.1 sulfur carrier protein ThiS [Aestuariibacter sp. A3R04]
MQVYFNDDPVAVPEECSLEAMVKELTQSNSKLAVAVNNTIVPRSQWAEFALSENDHIAAFTLVAGG